MPTLDPEEFFFEVADRFFNAYKYEAAPQTNYDIIIAKQNAPRPVGKYCMFQVLTSPKIGNEDESYNPENETIELDEIFEPMISVNVFDDYRKAMDFRKYLIKPKTLEYANEKEYVIVDVSGLRNLDFINDREFEKRYQFDVRLRVCESSSDPTDSIGTITIGSTLDTLKSEKEEEIIIE